VKFVPLDEGLPCATSAGTTLKSSALQQFRPFSEVLNTGPFYCFNRAGAKPLQPIIQNWWRQGMMGGAKAHYDSIKAFSETDFTEDLKVINVQRL
jgi:non-heme chloroperoxidase